MRDVTVDTASKSRNLLGESVVWDGMSGLLRWVDIHQCSLLSLEPASGVQDSRTLPDRIGAIGLRTSGGLVLGLENGFALVDEADSLTRLQQVDSHLPTTRLNDGKVDRQGRFVCGGMDEAPVQRPIADVHRLDANHAVERLLTGIRCANSICFSPDGTVMYFSDMPTGLILAYRYDTDLGIPHDPRVLVDMSDQPGLPDGSTVDAEGCLWNAQWGGRRVVRYTPHGRVDRVIDLPVSNPTCVAFGDTDLQTLFITSARFGLTADQLSLEPQAGDVFAVRLDVAGLPDPRFHG
jgi:L-arabinonolactonase